MPAEESDECNSDSDENCNYAEDADNVEYEVEDNFDQDWSCPISKGDEPSSESSDEEDIQEECKRNNISHVLKVNVPVLHNINQCSVVQYIFNLLLELKKILMFIRSQNLWCFTPCCLLIRKVKEMKDIVWSGDGRFDSIMGHLHNMEHIKCLLPH